MSGAGPVFRPRSGPASGLGPARRALSVCLLALAAGLSVAGCGGDERLSERGYERELEESGRAIESAFERVHEELEKVGTGSAPLETSARRLESAKEDLDGAADELDAIEAPGGLSQAHDDLVAGLRGLSDDVEAFDEALGGGSAVGVRRFVQEFDELPSVRRIAEACDDLRRRGYSAPALSGL